ncbi:MAG: hypothetical protein MRJ92_07415 [Nitrospira sp.]|nr:hypothetical protein [Nitrospira sp.]
MKVATTQFYPTIDLTGFVGFNALTLAKGTDKLANFLFSGQSFAYGLAPPPGCACPGSKGAGCGGVGGTTRGIRRCRGIVANRHLAGCDAGGRR